MVSLDILQVGSDSLEELLNVDDEGGELSEWEEERDDEAEYSEHGVGDDEFDDEDCDFGMEEHDRDDSTSSNPDDEGSQPEGTNDNAANRHAFGNLEERTGLPENLLQQMGATSSVDSPVISNKAPLGSGYGVVTFTDNLLFDGYQQGPSDGEMDVDGVSLGLFDFSSWGPALHDSEDAQTVTHTGPSNGSAEKPIWKELGQDAVLYDQEMDVGDLRARIFDLASQGGSGPGETGGDNWGSLIQEDPALAEMFAAWEAEIVD